MLDTELLHGIRVLDFASVGPAARASRWLSDFGADVIKIGAVPAQGSVQITPPAFAYGGHRRMRRALFDLKSADGVEAFTALAGTADVLIEGFRPGVMDRLGVGPEALRTRYPSLVYCSTSGYGQTGPRSGWAGHDLNYLAVSGFLATTTPAASGGPPVPGATIADAAGGGMHAALSILAALVQRERTGEGTYLDVSVADGMLSIMSLFADEYLATGEQPGPRHNILTGRYACYDVYRCEDGRWISVAAIEPRFWANLCRALGLNDAVEQQLDDAAQPDLRRRMSAAFEQRTLAEWVAQLGPADCCVAPVATVAEAVADDQYRARGAIQQAKGPSGERLEQTAPLLAGQEKPDAAEVLPNWEETDTARLLVEAGLVAGDVDDLVQSGAVA